MVVALTLLTLLVLTPLLGTIPNSVVSAVLIDATLDLVDVQGIQHVWKTDTRGIVLILALMTLTFFLGCRRRCWWGSGVGLIEALRRTAGPRLAVFGLDPWAGRAGTSRGPGART